MVRYSMPQLVNSKLLNIGMVFPSLLLMPDYVGNSLGNPLTNHMIYILLLLHMAFSVITTSSTTLVHCQEALVIVCNLIA